MQSIEQFGPIYTTIEDSDILDLEDDGEEFFPIGYYGPSFRDPHEKIATSIERIAEAGLNTIHLADISQPRFGDLLDLAADLDVNVIVGMTKWKGNDLIEDTIQNYRQAEAVVGWSLFDDADDRDWTIEEIEDRYDYIKSQDRDNFTYLTLTGYDESRRDQADEFASLTDVGAIQNYPIEPLSDYGSTDATALTDAYERSPTYVVAAEASNRPMLMNGQTSTWWADGATGNPDARYPTPEEFRNMMYSGLAAGMKGFVNYNYSEELYEDYKPLWNEFSAIGQDILGRTQDFYLDGTLTRYDTGDRELVASYFTHEDKLLLVVVNTSYDEAKDVAVDLPEGYGAAVSPFGRMAATLDLSDGTMAESIAAQGVQVYELTKTDPIPANPVPVDPIPVDEGAFQIDFVAANRQVKTLADVDFDGPSIGSLEAEVISFDAGRGEAFFDGGKKDMFGAKVTGQFDVEEAGAYTFFLNSDDGSKLTVSGQEVLNDGLHAARTEEVTIELEAGAHDLELLYFERFGRAVLDLDYSGPDTDGVRVPLTATGAGKAMTDVVPPKATGGPGNDVLGGTAADDVIVTGDGLDEVDLFFAGTDVVTDFDVNGGGERDFDRLTLTVPDADETWILSEAASFRDLGDRMEGLGGSAVVDGDDLILSYAGNTITMTGVADDILLA